MTRRERLMTDGEDTREHGPPVSSRRTLISRGVKALRRACPIMRRVHDVAGDPPLRRSAGGFEGLARIIVAQQLSTASAGAIWGRSRDASRRSTPRRLLAETDEGLRAAGLSRPKIRTLRALSEAVARRRPRPRRSRSARRRGRARGAVRGEGHRPVDGGHLHHVLPRPRRCVRRRRSRAADRGPACRRSRRPPQPDELADLPSAGGPGAAWRRDCCGPTIRI